MLSDRAKQPSRKSPEQAFAGALAIARDPRAGISQLTPAARTLVAFGALDEAEEIIERIERSDTKIHLGDLKAAIRQLRRGGVLSDSRQADGGGAEATARPKEVLISRSNVKTDRLIVVFTGRAKRFSISIRVLEYYLKRHGSHIIYLTDHSDKMFFGGLPNTAPGYETMLGLIRSTAKELGADRLCVMANSGGGFIGLRVAADLLIEAFLGFSIRTEFSRLNSGLVNDFGEAIFQSGVDEKLLINLRPYLAYRQYPKRGLLICGDSHPIDVAHAENLRSIPRFEIEYLPNHNSHDAVMGLIAKGQFEAVLTRFLGEIEPGP